MNCKNNFEAVSGEQVLAKLRTMPVMTWSYKTQDPSIRRMWPTAQDFRAAFGLGESEKLINTVDIGGINMAAIKALIERTDALVKENAELRARLEKLERGNGKP